jgi:hypothetical protein
VTRYTEGFSHFVASIAAPVASGWSVRRVGLTPMESAAFPRRTPQLSFMDNMMHDLKLERFYQIGKTVNDLVNLPDCV